MHNKKFSPFLSGNKKADIGLSTLSAVELHSERVMKMLIQKLQSSL